MNELSNEICKLNKFKLKFKFYLEYIKSFNIDYNLVQERINNVLNMTLTNYQMNIISHERYNSNLESIDELLEELYKLDYPLTLSKFSKSKNKKIKLMILKEKLLKITLKTGLSNLKDMLEYLIEDYKVLFTGNNIIEFLDKTFIPVDSKIFKRKLEKKNINVKNLDIINASLIDKIDGVLLEVPFDDNVLEIKGYFKKDPLNVNKKIDFLSKKIKLVKDGINLDKKFVESYILQMSTKDLMILNVENIQKKINRDFNHLEKLKSELLSSLVKEFLMSNIQDQVKILTLLLLNDSDDTYHLAYLLFEMIRTNNGELKYDSYISDDIFKCLHWSIQKKFKVATKRVENIRSKISDIKDDTISYEDRIVQMKANDSVKSKAMDKLKELKASKDSIKAQNYLDGLLKIPFGIYKKEKIISFLDDFISNIKNLINGIENTIKEMKDDDQTINVIKENVLEICKYFKDKDVDTSHKLEDFFINLDDKLSFINNKINKDEKFKDINFSNDKKIDEQNKSLEKLNKIKEINKEIDECDDDKLLNNLEFKISESIRDELINLRNLTINPTSPKLKNAKEINCNFEYEIEDMGKSSNIKDYLNWKSIESELINLLNEWNRYKHSKKEYIRKARSILDECVYGQKESKKHIERLIAQWINGKMEGNVFGIQGPPGVGKTTLCKKGLAKCLLDENNESRPFSFLALGGATNSSFLDGHNYTYLGSSWGRIAEILMETKCMNPIIYFDELDKVSKTENGREIIGILTHLTDSSQNTEFYDKYFSGVKLDLSKCMIIFSYNDSNLIDPILRDRITEVNVKSITKKEKIHICKNWLVPDCLDIVGYKKEDFIFSDEIINFVIETYTLEAGVRKLKEKIFEIVREVNLKRVLGHQEYNLPYIITEKFVKDLFSDKSKVEFTKIAKEPQIGLVNGLYATSAGIGGITLIEVMKTPSESKLSLELTGNQGDVMKESMRCAKTIAWNLLPYDIKKNITQEWEDLGPYGLHIHCPDAAMPKDGPSAGITITTAILSRLSNLKIKNTIAMTGEIDLNGKVHKIGGLDSKLNGARKAGVTKVLIPIDNKSDLDLILKDYNETEKKEYFNNFEVLPVSNIKEVIKESFLDDFPFNN